MLFHIKAFWTAARHEGIILEGTRPRHRRTGPFWTSCKNGPLKICISEWK